MKILIYGINYAPELTGIGKYSGEMAEFLAASGHEVRVVTAPPYYPRWKIDNAYKSWGYRKECFGNINVWRCPLWVPEHPSGIKRIVHLASFAITSFFPVMAHMFWKPDVVIVIEPPFFCVPTAAFFSRLTGAFSWLHIQDFEIDVAFELKVINIRLVKKIILAFEGYLLNRFDRISTISGKMLKKLEEKCLTRSKFVFFPNWVDTKSIYPNGDHNSLRAELGLGSNEIVALYSGNMGQKQGLEVIAGAARILVDRKKLRFVLCGHGAGYNQLRDQTRHLPNVLWVPLQPAERLNELLNLADIHLLPQRKGAADLVMPSKLTGIMASGKPVVATANRGTELWSVIQGRGLCVVPGNVEGFAQAILDLSVDSGLRKNLGAKARLYAEENLNKHEILERFLKELHGLALS